MFKQNPKLPKSGGAEKAVDIIKKFRNQQPSERLVKIISEYEVNTEKEKVSKKPAVAAKDVEF